MAKKLKKLKIPSKLVLISGVALLVIVVVGLGYWHYHNSPSQEVIQSTPSVSTARAKNSTNTQASTNPSSSDKQAATSNSSEVASNTQNPTDSSGQPPVAPTGAFVSNHYPGGNNPTAEQSSCNTTPGASCSIKFTNGNNTKTLAAQITDSNGTTIWNWDAASFPAGTWQVSATATLNGQTKTANDAMPLTIQ